jgi:hypothetical protein
MMKKMKMKNRNQNNQMNHTNHSSDSCTDYEPFGRVLVQLGKENDKESELGDFGVRKFSDETGRFLTYLK